ncbi:MAG TPA: A/G-specific adenine glycosylase [Candidatus Acidoferrum sp.]
MFTGRSLLLFRKNLQAWFAQFQRDLPWRINKDPYRIWISEIMLQQTRVAAVIPYYERFLEHFPNIQALAKAPQEEVLRLWSGLGYYSRARNLQKTAQQIVAQHDGIFPSTHTDVLALSGIGNYTAAAILSIAHGKKHAVLDGNVARVLARLGAIHGDLRANGRWHQLQKMADDLLDPHEPGDWNQAMMELGATICMPRSPQCLLCPVNQWCEARKQGVVACIPEKRNKRATEEITLATLVFVDAKGNSLLLAPPKTLSKSKVHANVAALLSRLWHFPTIEVHKDAAKELKSYVQENFLRGKTFAPALKPLKKVRHTVTYRSITILPFRADVVTLPRLPNSRIIPLADISTVAISNLTRKVARSALG